MGVNSLLDDEDDSVEIPDSTTLGELKEELGEEVVRRGVSYMFSLLRADKEYRESGDPEQLKEGFISMGVEESQEGALDKTGDKWSEKMKDRGLGLDSDE